MDFNADVICLVLVHNEAHLLPDLFAHYRAMGPVQFLVIDDRSTDGTRSLLVDQPDVTLFEPVEGSTYAANKRDWRGSLLDGFASGKWCLVIDADERLVWRGYPARSLTDLIASFEVAGTEAFICAMLDMYADRPIADHIAGSGTLATQFPCYDDPRKDALAYRLALTPKAFRRKFPLPNTVLMGGMRDRLFDAPDEIASFVTRFWQRGALSRPRQIPDSAVPMAQLITQLTRPRRPRPPLNLTKVPLVKWRSGLRYNGGAHHLSADLEPAREYGVLLHYAITQGTEGVAYLANRGQHANGGGYYQSILDRGELSSINPVYPGTSCLNSIADLDPFFGDLAP